MSVDPLADHPRNVSWSPYAYTWNNPLKYTDPTGMIGEWHQDPNNKNLWIADEGDSAWSLHKDSGVSAKDADAIVQAKYGPNYKGADGEMKSNIDPGAVVNISSAECCQVEKEIQTKEIKRLGLKVEQLTERYNSTSLEIEDRNINYKFYRFGSKEPTALQEPGEKFGFGINALRTEVVLNKLKNDTSILGKSIRLYKDSIKMEDEK